MKKKHRDLLIFSILTALNLSVLTGFFLNERISAALTKESGYIESAGVIFFAIALFFLVKISLKRKNIILPIIWALLCVIFIGEETSWFQHYFHYEVPAVEKINVQNEFNIHNLEIFQGGKLTGSEVALTEALFKSQNLFRIGFFGYFLILPLLYKVPAIGRLLQHIDYKRPGALFIVSLIIVFATSFFLVPEASHITKKALAETREMLYALYILLYVRIYMWPENK
jgi:hypothetical protein